MRERNNYGSLSFNEIRCGSFQVGMCFAGAVEEAVRHFSQEPHRQARWHKCILLVWRKSSDANQVSCRDTDTDNDSNLNTLANMSKTIVNFWLDTLLLILFILVLWSTAVVRFVFPAGTTAVGWQLWGWSYDQWVDVQTVVDQSFRTCRSRSRHVALDVGLRSYRKTLQQE